MKGKRLSWAPVRAGILALAVLVGCGREQPPNPGPASEGSAPKRIAITPLSNLLDYVSKATLDSGVPELRGIAVDARDRIYAAGARGIVVLDRDGKKLNAWATSGPARCVAVGQDRCVYVGLKRKVEKYDSGGKLVKSWGKPGKAGGEFDFIASIAVSQWDVFVADAGNRCIHRFDVTGDYAGEIGKRDTSEGFLGLVVPSMYLDLAVNDKGQIVVGNPGLRRVETYSPDGRLRGHWGRPGIGPEGFCGCCNPIHLALDRGGNVVTSEKGIPRVKVHDSSGKLMAVFDKKMVGGAVGDNDAALAGRFFGDIAIDSRGRILVANPLNGKIWVFERKGKPLPEASGAAEERAK